MKEIKLKIVKIEEPSNILDSLISYSTIYHKSGNLLYSLDFKSSIFTGVFESPDIFSCLCELRKSLEKIGWYILCNGSRINVCATGMARQMGGGFKIYLLTMGEPMHRKNLVYIFDEVGLEEVGTVDQQLDFLQKWIKFSQLKQQIRDGIARDNEEVEERDNP